MIEYNIGLNNTSPLNFKPYSLGLVVEYITRRQLQKCIDAGFALVENQSYFSGFVVLKPKTADDLEAHSLEIADLVSSDISSICVYIDYILIGIETFRGYLAVEEVLDEFLMVSSEFLLRKSTFVNLVSIMFDLIPLAMGSRGRGFTGQIHQFITDIEAILQKFSDPYHPQSTGLEERSNRGNKMGFKCEDWDLYLPLSRCS